MKKSIIAGLLTAIIGVTQSQALVYYAESNYNYMLPISSALYLETADIDHLTSAEARIARNEIYAKHGSLFYVDDMDIYFRGKAWYQPLPQGIKLDTNLLSDIEKKNIQLLASYEQSGAQPITPSKPVYKVVDTEFTNKIIGFDVVTFMDTSFDSLDKMLDFLDKYKFELIKQEDFKLTLVDNIKTELVVQLDYDGDFVSVIDFNATVINYDVDLKTAKERHLTEYQTDNHFIYADFEDGTHVNYYFSFDSLQNHNPTTSYVTITKNRYK